MSVPPLPGPGDLWYDGQCLLAVDWFEQTTATAGVRRRTDLYGGHGWGPVEAVLIQPQVCLLERGGWRPVGLGRVWLGAPPDGTSRAPPRSWERGPRAAFRVTFCGGADGLWLHFHRDAELAYTSFHDARCDGEADVPTPTRVLRVRAGQLVRVVDSRPPDDGMGHEPTVRADFAEVHVSAADAAVQVSGLPGPDAMRRVYQRSAADVAFWKAILAAPEDDVPRLVYADWLDEHGDRAGAILRGTAPLALNYAVCVDGKWDEWEHRNRRRADWRLAACELQAFVAQRGGYFHDAPGYARIALRRFARTPQRRPAGGGGEWQCLSVSMESGEPLPPFLNYLLILSALALLVRRLRVGAGLVN